MDINERFFVDYLERLENLRISLSREVRDLPEEAMDWVPGPQMNSAAVLLAHTAGSLRYWLGDVALGDSSQRLREREFQTRGQTADEMLARLDAVVDYARAALPRLALNDLEQERVKEDGKTVTCGWALLHALEHGYLHLGHIQMTCQMWRLARR